MPYHQNLHHHHARAAEPDVKTVESVVYVTAEKNFEGPVAGYSTPAADSAPTPAPAPVAAAKKQDAPPRLAPGAIHPDAQIQEKAKSEDTSSSGSSDQQAPNFHDSGSDEAPPSSDPPKNVVGDSDGSAKGTPMNHPSASSSTTGESSSKPTEDSHVAGTPVKHSASPAISGSESTATDSGSNDSGTSVGAPVRNAGSSSAPSAQPEAESSGMSSGGKAGLAIGIIAIACILAGLAFFFYRKKKRQTKGEKLDDEKTGYNEKSGFDAMQPGLVPRVSVRKQHGETPRLSMRPVTNMFGADSNDHSEKSPVGASFVNGAALAAPAPAARAPEPQKPMIANNPFTDDAAAPVEAPKPLNISRPSTPTGQQSERSANSPPMAAPIPAVVNGGPGPGPSSGPPPTNVHRVQLDFAPSMDDELELRSGMLVRLTHEYDDGWALCTRLNGDQQGVVPRSCLSKLPVKPRPPPPQGHPNGSPQQRPRGPPPPGVRTRHNGPPPNGAPRMRSATNGGSPPKGRPMDPAINPFGDENRPRSNSAGSPPKQGSSPTLGSNGLPSRKPVGGSPY